MRLKIINFLIIVSIMLFSMNIYGKKAVKPAGAEQSKTSIYNDGVIDYATSAASFAIASEDVLSAVKSVMYKIDDGKYEEYKTPISIKDEGTHIIYYYSIDNVGNKSVESIYKVVIDNTAPEVSIVPNVKLYTADNKNYAPLSCEYILKASDNLSGVKKIEYAIDKGQYQEYKTAIKLTAGEHTIKYRAVDNVGNASAEKSLTVVVDGKSPELKIIPSGQFYKKGNKQYAPKSFQYQIEATDTESKIAKILVAIDNGNFVIYDTPISIDQEGEHTIKAKAIDNVGNESAVASLSFIVDNTPPKLELNIK